MTSTDKVNILMVDDQPGKLLSYEAILGDLGENLLKANSGREALEQLLKREVAVVLMDVSMPELSGFDLADMIRQHPRFQRTAIIFISAVHLSDVDLLKGYARGAVDYISVPVIPELLRAKVSVFVELYRKTRQLEELNRELEARVAERTILLQRSADLLELATEAIMVRDASGRVTYWNAGAETLYGWKRDEMLGQDLHRTLQTRFPASVAEVDTVLFENGKWEGNLVQTTKAGREITVACRKSLKLDERGVTQEILEIGRDITERLQTEEALRKSERLAAMGRMAGIIAHEINNPLEAITNAFFLLRDHPSLDETALRYARIADQELARVARITSQTLGFYREPQQSMPLRMQQVLDDVLELQGRRLQLNSITLEKDYHRCGEVLGFSAELKQVFLNLTTNAIHAMPAGGRLRVRIVDSVDRKSERPGVRVTLSDNGSGIKAEDAKRLFEPFFSTKAAKGTGLGLWISKGIVTKYEGTIHFRSLGLNGRNATCFSVFIPGSDAKRKTMDRTEKRKVQEAIGSL